jgi:hypothetical protein
MAREYIAAGSNMTLNNIADAALVFVNPGATIGTACALEFMRAWLSQSGTTTLQRLEVTLSTQVTAFPTLTTTTPRKLKQLDPASLIVGGTAGAAGTCGINASVAGGGAKSKVWPDNCDNLNGWLWVASPDETIIMPAMSASGLGLYLPVAPTGLTLWTAGLLYRELG